MSKRAKIRVLFTGDIAREDQNADGVLTLQPAASGDVRFATAREVVFTPTKDLQPGKTYRIRLSPKKLTNLPASLTPYEFDVAVQEPGLEVDVVGLSPSSPRGGASADSVAPSSAKPPIGAQPPSGTQPPAGTKPPFKRGTLSLSGTLTTADVESTSHVEQLVTASYMGRALPLVWTHSQGALQHAFTISGIERQAGVQPLDIVWDGKAIGASTRGKTQVSVPPRDQFLVTTAAVVEDQGQRYIAVRFSDPLNTRQDLRGLVTLSTGNFTSRIDANVLKIFPEVAADGDATVTLQPGIRSADGARLEKLARQTVTFQSTRPQVRFVGEGVILPPSKTISIPFEAVNVRAVRVTAFEINEESIGQFLQVNTLRGNAELGRVGRTLWRKKIPLTAVQPGRWNRYGLDVGELFKQHPHALIQLTLQIQRPDSTYSCPGKEEVESVDTPIVDQDSNDQAEESNWDYAEDYYGVQDGSKWSDRENPCTDAYFVYSQGSKEARNFLASNIGLTAKADRHGKFLIVATDLRTSKPLSGVKLDLKNFQNRSVGTVTTDATGLANITPNATPYAVFAQKDGERGYLKVNAGTSLPVSHFDTGGEIVMGGLKGIIYGERGVWRPGDSIYLTFVLQDLEKRLPADHPVTLELYNPRGQRVQSVTNAKPVNGFYSFTLATEPEAPTGDWTAKAILGGATFTKTLKIETVMPNRLKVDLDVGDKTLKTGAPLHAKLSSQWLTGAAADSLDADVSLRLTTTATHFDRYTDFVFDDPAREMKAQTGTIFTGKLDAEGRVSFDATIEPSSPPPGMLTANFTSRVFERGGAFSTNRSSAPYAPYARFIGIKLPKGDVARGMLQTDTTHTVEIASLSADGKPVSVNKVRVTLYQVEWRWWWDQSGESLAQYAQASQSSIIKEGVVETKDGKATWDFQVLYPQWGRYLVRACDEEGGHCTGKTVYIDWPSWAGRRQEQSGPAASALTLTANKDQYKVGDIATIQLPQANEGRALVTVETGTTIVEARWLELSKKESTFSVPVTAAMSPNAYVSVTLIQPHENKDNDRPIRLYGVIPLKVENPATNLKPVIRVAKEWRPEANASIEVAEASGHEMTYTLAVVDEGLLGLTSYKTPNLHDHFYKREALGISTWDLFDDVVGAYGAQIERLLALGGSDKQEGANPDERQSRFPPVVKVLGPFTLKAGLTGKHEVKLPPYVGAVRVMLVAGNQGAYGSTEKSVFVRQPLMLLPTLPRVIGPTEEAAVPVSLFVMDDSIRDVTLKAETDGLLQLQDGDSVSVHFDRAGDKVGLLKVKAAPRVGKSRIRFIATSGKHRAQAEVVIEVRSPNPPTTNSVTAAIKAGERWETQLKPHGLAGTNTVTLEVSAVPPLGLDRRLDYLIQYPYGCLEQTTSSVFPQLYLPALVKLEESRRSQVETNVRSGIQRLRGFQLPSGAFTYWPGGFFAGINDARGGWATNYAGHFLIEAEKLGYTVPPDMMKDFLRYQSSAASAWTPTGATPALEQAYRLYTLALANQAEIGAMNRLRETANLNSSGRWMLAAAYKLAGMKSVADDLTRGMPIAPVGPRELDEIFSSELRDSAIVLTSAVVLGRAAESKALADEVSAQLASEHWYSTQSVAYSLMAISKYIGGGTMGDFTYKRGSQTVTSTSPIQSEVLRNFPDSGAPIAIENTSQRTLFVTVFDRGVPAAGTDDAMSSGFSLDVHYTDAAGAPIDITRVPQGTDLIAEISIRNLTQHRIENIALAQLVPAGWEIENERLAGGDPSGTREEDEKKHPGFLYIPDGSPSATAARAEYVDIRDDRIYRYFSLKADEQIYFRTRLNATYRGHYYLPSIAVEAMYDATKVARSQGAWVDVTAKEH